MTAQEKEEGHRLAVRDALWPVKEKLGASIAEVEASLTDLLMQVERDADLREAQAREHEHKAHCALCLVRTRVPIGKDDCTHGYALQEERKRLEIHKAWMER